MRLFATALIFTAVWISNAQADDCLVLAESDEYETLKAEFCPTFEGLLGHQSTKVSRQDGKIYINTAVHLPSDILDRGDFAFNVCDALGAVVGTKYGRYRVNFWVAGAFTLANNDFNTLIKALNNKQVDKSVFFPQTCGMS
ncbi:MAG: hypothetical protein JJ979_11975 [Roseibium sp.]|nr:hypothetical protein [Roseibium sp.]